MLWFGAARACVEMLCVAAADWCGAAVVEMPWRTVGNAVCLSKARVVHVARRIRWRGDFLGPRCLYASVFQR